MWSLSTMTLTPAGISAGRAAVVHGDYEAANAAVYSNIGREECWAVFGAAGVIYDPVLQTCVFEE